MQNLTVVTIARNEEKYIEPFLKHLVNWVSEVIIVLNYSTDKTRQIAERYTDKVFTLDDNCLGNLKNFGLSKVSSDWILLIDVDEFISDPLKLEIEKIIASPSSDAYSIPYHVFFGSHKLVCENYSKVRLFKKKSASVSNDCIHEEVVATGSLGSCTYPINHFSYRNFFYTAKKFTYYAQLETATLREKKEVVTLKKLTLYPLHMFYSRYIESKGHTDGISGFLLSLLFAYYEFARYFFLLVNKSE